MPTVKSERTPPALDLPGWERVTWLAVRVLAAIGIMVLAIWIALSPNAVYTATPRTVLFLLIALLPAILIGAESSAYLKVEAKMRSWAILGVVTGTAAILIAVMWVLYFMAKPTPPVLAIYHVRFASEEAVELDRTMVSIRRTSDWQNPTYFVDGNDILVRFPDGVEQITIIVKPFVGVEYEKMVTYAESDADLILGD